jgi:hypothetical protein
MIAEVRGRGYLRFAFGLAAAVVAAGQSASAQDDAEQKFKLPPPAPRTNAPGPATNGKKTVRLDKIYAPALQLTQIPVNPGDPILKVIGQIITRQQLADECIARKGKEIAEILIHRTLVEQALRAKRLEVTGSGPGRPRDYSLGLPQILTCRDSRHPSFLLPRTPASIHSRLACSTQNHGLWSFPTRIRRLSDAPQKVGV